MSNEPLPLEELTDDQIELRGASAGLFEFWIWPAVLRVEGSPDRAAAYLRRLVTLAKRENPTPRGRHGDHRHMMNLVEAANQISMAGLEGRGGHE